MVPEARAQHHDAREDEDARGDAEGRAVADALAEDADAQGAERDRTLGEEAQGRDDAGSQFAAPSTPTARGPTPGTVTATSGRATSVTMLPSWLTVSPRNSSRKSRCVRRPPTRVRSATAATVSADRRVGPPSSPRANPGAVRAVRAAQVAGP